MKISLVYLWVTGKATSDAPEPSYYEPFHKRFRETYQQFKPDIEHELVIVRCGDGDTGTAFGVGDVFLENKGKGWDCGTYQRIAPKLDCDMAVFMATPVYFWREGWLDRFVEAWAMHGEGLYGPMASFENQAHLRTSCIVCHPSLLSIWPHRIDTHLDCSAFEQAFSLMVMGSDHPCMLVTWDGEYDVQEWRKPKNIFRRGDQSNTLLRDRHWDIYNEGNAVKRMALALLADGVRMKS